jgi:uncharacterized OB-fold protein
VTEGLFCDRGDGTARLLGSRCRRCRRYAFPRGEVCPYCSAEECDPAELGPDGSLWLFTSVLRPPPGYRGGVPFGFGIVELDEGLRVVTRLTEPDVSRLERGQAMRLVVDRLHVDEEGRDVVTYAFAPVDAK